ncbi:MAG: hypothetical protein OEU32_12135 [Acidimicrobiia bacterium]|nr:hypothetical protein [Acidimicrobiia bacterium]
MTVHIGEVVSEVSANGRTSAAEAATDEESVWAERARIEALIERLARDRCRTSTGGGDD